MDAVQATRETLGLVHQYLDAAIGDCEADTLKKTFPGSTIGSILSIYAHALASEDWAVQELLQKKAKIVDSGHWYARWRLPAPPAGEEADWANLDVALADIQEYASAVYAATDQWLNAATDADLDQPIDWHDGSTRSAGWVLADVIHAHGAFHAGEIAALKGVMGLKGLPW